jgi:hypothetical protein
MSLTLKIEGNFLVLFDTTTPFSEVFRSPRALCNFIYYQEDATDYFEFRTSSGAYIRTTTKIDFTDLIDNRTGLAFTNIAELQEFLSLNLGAQLNPVQIIKSTGWGTYVDTDYPDSGTPFSVSANTDTALPNNKGTVIETQKPEDVTTFYDGTVITGRSGDNLDVMIYFKAVPSAVDQWLDMWIYIGGTIGELYRQTFTFPKGSGVERGVLYALPSAYTLDTWEANGGTVYIRSNHSIDIYGINYNLDRSHKSNT